jgi:hypothetical protein
VKEDGPRKASRELMVQHLRDARPHVKEKSGVCRNSYVRGCSENEWFLRKASILWSRRSTAGSTITSTKSFSALGKLGLARG